MLSRFKASRTKVLVPLYFPWALSSMVQYEPILSYLVAWTGSFFIFYLTIFSKVGWQSLDLPVKHQVMRPIILIQLVFAGFMCSTSIFYFADNIDGEFQKMQLIAECQRIALLAHAALVTGLILFIQPLPFIKYRSAKPLRKLLTKLCFSTLAASQLLDFLPVFVQFKYPLLAISGSSGSYLLIHGIRYKSIQYILSGSTVFGFNLLNASLTGYKEIIITQFITLAFLAFPYYRKAVTIMAIPVCYLLLYVLPTFTIVVRTQSWFNGKSKETARDQAFQTFFQDDMVTEINNNNREFLTQRLSEIGMFLKYIKCVPDQHPYYGFQIFSNGLYTLVPRALWSEKPETERLAMERVYQCGIANRESTVSAKTRPVVDGYLIAGLPGVFLYMLFYGIIAQLLCNLAEKLFGGYQIGCIIIFNGIFQTLWRGNTFEFLLNNIFYGYLLMRIISFAMKKSGLLTYQRV